MKVQNRFSLWRLVRCRAAFILWLLSVVTGCAVVGPDYQAPHFTHPVKWKNIDTDSQNNDARQLAQWWQALDDAMLTRLLQQAAVENTDIREAVSKVREARLRRLTSRSALFPTLDANGSARKNHQEETDGATVDSELYSVGFDAGWELDLFGGVRRSVEATRADLEAQLEDYNDVMVTLLAEVAVNYIDLRTYQTRLEMARRNLASQKETWEVVDALARAGGGDELAVAQARYNLESSRAKIPDLETGLEAAMNRLAVLTGRPAGTLHDELAEAMPIPQVSINLAVGVPADVIRQRPDIRRAERELAAQTARIGVAEADLYPSFSLTGSIGLEAVSLDKLFSSATRTWSFGPSFSWPIFDAGAIRNNIKLQTELREQTLISYEAAILTALEEVENALITYAKEQQKLGMLQAAAEAARLAAELAGHQYSTGLIGFSDVLDAQRSLLSFEDQLAESRGAVLSDLVRLYKALGGGWQSFSRDAEPQGSSLQGTSAALKES